MIRDHEVAATTPDDDHLLEFLLGADQGPQFVIPDGPDERARLFAWHRERSIHVHCWTDDEFTEILRYCADVLGHDWECRDRMSTAESGMEFGFVLVQRRAATTRVASRSSSTPASRDRGPACVR